MKICENGIYREMTEEEVNASNAKMPPELRKAELEQMLADTDYIPLKIVEGEATFDEYADVFALRKAWRKEINELEAVLGGET